MMKTLLATFVGLLLTSCSLALAQTPLSLKEQQAFQTAAAAASRSIVQIETVGGVDLVGETLTGTGPTTGVVVSSDGYIMTSSFNFVSQPASIIVSTGEGDRYAANIVASDSSRMLTLLKVEAEGLTPLAAIPRDEVQVGQWAIALGRTYDINFPSVSVGIISALNRISGRAFQTDAKTSPVNYGGPLVDLSGRAYGVIVPLSPQEQGETAGVEWYDGGIGFAIPMEDVYSAVARLKAGDDLAPGLLGVSFVDQGPLSGEAKVVRVRPQSPAEEAGLEVDDIITGINGQPVRRLNDLRQILGRLYGGDEVMLAVKRGDETLEVTTTLVSELTPFEAPALGILPERALASEMEAGVGVRHVLEGTAAAEAGLEPGDRVLAVDGENVETVTSLYEMIRAKTVGESLTLSIRREEAMQEVEVTLREIEGVIPESFASQVVPPPAEGAVPQDLKRGRFTASLPGVERGFWGFVPESYNPEAAYGLVVWIHPAGDSLEAALLRDWKAACEQRGIMVVGPRAEDVSGWTPRDAEFVRATIEWMQSRYRIDPRRIAIMGHEDGGQVAYLLSLKYQDLIRGAIVSGTPLRTAPPPHSPEAPLQLLLTVGEQDVVRPLVVKTVDQLREAKYPTALETHAAEAGQVFTAEMSERLVRWLDALDQI